jgi:flavin reductase (DIM6/NTAB) family NADH-FMN oxidoreductase RutF
MEQKVLQKISYGLYLVTTAIDACDSGCIVNSVTEVTSSPLRVQITMNKANYTHELIQKSSLVNLCILDETVPFSLFERFGFQTGKNTKKFQDFKEVARSKNGVYYLTNYANAYLSGIVVSQVDLGTHTMFILEVTDGEVLNQHKSLTYSDYHQFVKPKVQIKASSNQEDKWVCNICGYVYDNSVEPIKFEDLPDTWVCPTCKHPKSDFTKI